MQAGVVALVEALGEQVELVLECPPGARAELLAALASAVAAEAAPPDARFACLKLLCDATLARLCCPGGTAGALVAHTCQHHCITALAVAGRHEARPASRRYSERSECLLVWCCTLSPGMLCTSRLSVRALRFRCPSNMWECRCIRARGGRGAGGGAAAAAGAGAAGAGRPHAAVHAQAHLRRDGRRAGRRRARAAAARAPTRSAAAPSFGLLAALRFCAKRTSEQTSCRQLRQLGLEECCVHVLEGEQVMCHGHRLRHCGRVRAGWACLSASSTS